MEYYVLGKHTVDAKFMSKLKNFQYYRACNK